jgi:(p)ppGpp synthase/HD superfamily hydrolase
MICAALLHDVVEDTHVTLRQLFKFFSPSVVSMVDDLTKRSKLEDGNRATRKRIDLKHTAKASPEAKTIKLADVYANIRDIKEQDPDFAVTYLREKKALLEVLTEGDATLFNMVKTQIEKGV